MTIAGVYVSPEGIVFGADSTSSVAADNGFHYFDFNQKLFEIGSESTLGLVTWGLGGLGPVSYRTLLAEFSDALASNAAKNLDEVVQRWIDAFWAAYSAFDPCKQFDTLGKKAALGQPPTATGVRTADEELEFSELQTQLVVGFCIAGYVLPSRTPEARTVIFTPGQNKPIPTVINSHSLQWWGVPNFFSRLMYGLDGQIMEGIKNSGKWTGSDADLVSIAQANAILPRGVLPIRDAVDYVHTCIHCTIKAIKFSGLPQVCGGPIELAVITSDRKFRWVRHKNWDAAIVHGANHER